METFWLKSWGSRLGICWNFWMPFLIENSLLNSDTAKSLSPGVSRRDSLYWELFFRFTSTSFEWWSFDQQFDSMIPTDRAVILNTMAIMPHRVCWIANWLFEIERLLSAETLSSTRTKPTSVRIIKLRAESELRRLGFQRVAWKRHTKRTSLQPNLAAGCESCGEQSL